MKKVILPIEPKSRYGKTITRLNEISDKDKVVLISDRDYLITDFLDFNKRWRQFTKYSILEILPNNCFKSSKAFRGYKGWLGTIIKYGGYENWLQKWMIIRRKGPKKIESLLITNRGFAEKWREKTIKGGKSLKPEQRWFSKFDDKRLEKVRKRGGKSGGKSLVRKFGKKYMRIIGSKGGMKSVESINNFRRKRLGPKNEKMFNMLEVKTAQNILNLGLDYFYGKPIKIGDSYIIPDFQLKNNSNIFIECTTWSDINYKAKKMNNRFSILKNKNKNVKMIVVTIKSLIKQYKEKLRKGIKLCDLDSLKDVLCPSGSVR